MNIRHFIVPLTVAAFAMQTAIVSAQGAFPAPLPGQSSTPASSPFPPVGGNSGGGGGASPFPPVAGEASPFPPVNGAAPAASMGGASPFPSAGAAPLAGAGGMGAPPPGAQAAGEACMKEFLPMRQEAERRGEAIRKASERRAPPAEACKLIGQFAQSEQKMIRFINANSERCGIPEQVSAQMRDGNKNTEKMRAQVCQVAQQVQQQQRAGAAAAPTFSDVLGSSAALPDPAAGRRRGGSTFDTLSGNVLAR